MWENKKEIVRDAGSLGTPSGETNDNGENSEALLTSYAGQLLNAVTTVTKHTAENHAENHFKKELSQPK